MFNDNFTFAPPRSPSLLATETHTSSGESSKPVSPCSPAPPSLRFTVTDLAVHFANSRLQQESQIRYDPCASYANVEDDDAAWRIPDHQDDGDDDTNNTTTATASKNNSALVGSKPRLSPLHLQRSHCHSSSRRMQRQVSTRLLCLTSHAREIATLVAQMVARGEQCAVLEAEGSKQRRTTTGEEEEEGEEMMEDEGYDEGYDSGNNHQNSRHNHHSHSHRNNSEASPSRARNVALATGMVVPGTHIDYKRSTEVRKSSSYAPGSGAGGARVCKAVRCRKEKGQHPRIGKGEKKAL